MRKEPVIFLAFILAVSLFTDISSALNDDLAYLAKDRRPVSVFLKELKNESGQDRIKVDDFKKIFEAALLRRKAVTFTVVSAPDASDIQISCNLKKYLHSETDPINSYAGTPGMLLDALTVQNYAEITGEFTVVDTKSGKVIWKKSVMAYVEGAMTPEESMPLVYDKLARTFLWRSFGKANK